QDPPSRRLASGQNHHFAAELQTIDLASREKSFLAAVSGQKQRRARGHAAGEKAVGREVDDVESFEGTRLKPGLGRIRSYVHAGSAAAEPGHPLRLRRGVGKRRKVEALPVDRALRGDGTDNPWIREDQQIPCVTR